MGTKSLKCFYTIEYTFGDGLTIKRDKIKIQGIGPVKIFWHTQLPENVTYAKVTRRVDQYYVTFCFDFFSEVGAINDNNAVGIDFGLKHFLTLSDGSYIESPKFHKQSLKEEAKIHRKIHKHAKGTRLRKKYVKALRKVRKRIANKRKNFNHHISKKIINSYSSFYLEDLNLNQLSETNLKNINRTYRDVAFGQFKRFLTYKAENAGKKVTLVNPEYTSQMCSACGKIQKKKISERDHICMCGYSDCRDINAAKNILRLGLQPLGNSLEAREIIHEINHTLKTQKQNSIYEI